MDFRKELDEVIRKQLPEELGSEFRKLLEEHSANKKSLQRYKDQEGVLCGQLKSCERLTETQEKIINKLTARGIKDKDLSEREFKLDYKILEADLDASNRVIDTYESIMSKLCQNTMVKTRILTKKPDTYGTKELKTIVEKETTEE